MRRTKMWWCTAMVCALVTSAVAVAAPASAGSWSPWVARGGSLISAPAVTSWGPGRLDVFARGLDTTGKDTNRLAHRVFADGHWQRWNDLGILPGDSDIGGPAAVSWGSGRIDLFVTATNGHLGHKWFSNGTWKQWQDLGGAITGTPAVISWGPGKLDVFARSAGARLVRLRFADGAWQPWQDLGSLAGMDALTAVSWGPGRTDLFAVTTATGRIWQRTYNGSWSGWSDRGGDFPGGVGVVSWAAGRIDLFGKMLHRDLAHAWFSTGTWKSWQNLGGGEQGLNSRPGAASWAQNRIDVFGVDDNGMLLHRTWS